MAAGRGAPRASRRRLPRGKTSGCSATMLLEDRSTAPCKSRSDPMRGRGATCSRNCVSTLPNDLWTLVLRFFTWHETSAMLQVCSSWRRIAAGAKKQHAEWRSTVLGPAVNTAESLQLLRANHLKWADTRFAPDLVLISAASRDPIAWRNGGYWQDALAAVEEEKLLPRSCKVVGVFTMNAVLREVQEEENATTDRSEVTLSVSVMHLPETKVEMAAFERKELRRHHRGGAEVDYPFDAIDSEHDTPSFLMFGVNDQSAGELVPIVEKWHPGAVVVGAVSPLVDRCAPLATYECPDEQPVARGERQRRKSKRLQMPQPQSKRRLCPRSQVEFPSTLLIRLHGKVGVRAFASSGYHPITPVVQCVRANIEEQLSQVVTYDHVSMHNQDSPEAVTHRIMDLLEPSERHAIEQEGKGLNIFSCREKAPLETLVAFTSNFFRSRESKQPVPASETLGQIDRLEFVFWMQGGLMSLPGLCWQEGAYGVLASLNPMQSFPMLAEALRYARSRLTSNQEQAFGVFMAVGALNEVKDISHADEVARLFAKAFRDLPLGGCIVSNSVGPIAFPGGLQRAAAGTIAQVQTHTTCGAIFYTKSEDMHATSGRLAQVELNA